MKSVVDCFILTFSDNTTDVIKRRFIDNKGVTGISDWLNDLTNGRAEFLQIVDEGIEVSIPFWDFLQLKDNHNFQCHCSNLIRLRTSGLRSLMATVAYPIASIDNHI